MTTVRKALLVAWAVLTAILLLCLPEQRGATLIWALIALWFGFFYRGDLVDASERASSSSRSFDPDRWLRNRPRWGPAAARRAELHVEARLAKEGFSPLDIWRMDAPALHACLRVFDRGLKDSLTGTPHGIGALFPHSDRGGVYTVPILQRREVSSLTSAPSECGDPALVPAKALYRYRGYILLRMSILEARTCGDVTGERELRESAEACAYERLIVRTACESIFAQRGGSAVDTLARRPLCGALKDLVEQHGLRESIVQSEVMRCLHRYRRKLVRR